MPTTEPGSSIPKIIHYVWVGPRELPDGDKRRVEEWRKLLPDWEIRAWGNEEVDHGSRYLQQAYSVKAWNRVSDYTRMDALTRFGGVYLDTDVDILKPFDPLLGNQAFLGFQVSDEKITTSIVNGAVFGARQGHWLPTEIRRRFNEEMDGRADMGAFSGPGLLTKILRERGLTGYADAPIEIDHVTIYPKRFFYPYSWQETFSPDVVTDDTYAVHLWADSWVAKSPSLKSRFKRQSLNALRKYFPGLTSAVSRTMTRRSNLTKGS